MAEKKIEQLEILHFKAKVMLLRTFKGIYYLDDFEQANYRIPG